jgi:hypothetical protein
MGEIYVIYIKLWMTGIILSALKGNNPFKKCKKKQHIILESSRKSTNGLLIMCLLMFL